MRKRFENFATTISQIYKSIQKIKKYHMQSLGLKGTYVMCLYHLHQASGGLTASDLCRLCKENKAGISRILSNMARMASYAMPAKATAKNTVPGPY